MAKTSLARQLELLKTPQSTVHRETKGSVSLLYDFFDAKSIDSNTHFSVALDGLEGMIKIDYSLARFKENLFHETSKNLDRSVMSAEENEKLDEFIEEYLFNVVSKYFQITDTMKTLEWLVYRYKVHLYNVDAYVGSVLPYHGTRQFARVLQTVSKIKDPNSVRWYWLKQIQMQAVPLSINVLVTHCAANRDFFRYIIDQIFKAVQIDETNVRFVSFMVMFCVKILEHNTSEEVVSMVVSCISKCLRKNKPLFYSPACIILSHLSSLVKLDNTVLMKLLQLFSPRYTKPAGNKTFLALNIICKTQDLDHFPEEFFSGIIINELFKRSTQYKKCDSLILALFGTLIHFSSDEKLKHDIMLENVENLLQNKTIMRKEAVHEIIRRINDALELFDSEQMEQDDENFAMQSKNAEEFLKNLVRLFEKHYPLALDSAIAELDSSAKISELLNSFRFSQIQEYNIPLFVGLEHSSKKVRRSSLIYLVKNFKNHITAKETDYIRSILKKKFFEDFQTTSVQIFLDIFSVGEQIFNIFSPDEFQKIAFKLLHFCEQNLAAKREGENDMEIDEHDEENIKWFQLKKKLLEIFFSKKFTEYYLEDPHFIAQSLFFASDSRFRLVNFLFPSDHSQFVVYQLLLSSAFGRTHPFLKMIQPENKANIEEDFEKISWNNFNILVKYIQDHLEIFLDKDNLKKAMESTLEENSDSYCRSLMFYVLALSQVFQEYSDKSFQQVIGSTILECFDFVIKKFPLAKISRKTRFEMFSEISDDCFQSSLRQNSIFVCSKMPSTTLVFILHKMISSYKFSLKNSWSMFQDGCGDELVAYKLFKMLMFLSNPKNRQVLPSKHTSDLFQKLFQHFSNKIIFARDDIFSFFLPILIDDTSAGLRLETLSILNGLIQKEDLIPRFVDSLSNERKTLIGHLLALASEQQECRQSVIENLQFLHSRLDPKKDAFVFIKNLFEHKDEMILDHKLLSKTFSEMHHSPDASHKFVEHIVNDLLQEFFKGSLPVECRCLVIRLFTNFNNATREKIFKFYHDTLMDFSNLNQAQEHELQALLGYFINSKENNLFEKSDSFSVKFYLNALSATETCLSTEACLIILRAFGDSFQTMSEKNPNLALKIAMKLLEMELKLSESGSGNKKIKHMKLISWLRRSISCVISNGKFTSNLMKNILDIEEAANSFAALVKETPIKKKAKLDSSELNGKFLRSWKLLRILVGCIQRNHIFNDSSVLVKSLFDYFRLTFSHACDASIMEHTRQIFLYAISHMVEVELGTTSSALQGERKRRSSESETKAIEQSMKKERKPTKKQNDEQKLFLKQIDIQAIVDCLSESRYQDTQKIALLTLSLLSSHFYIQILDSLVAIFTYIGTSLLQCDDQYSLAILYETIESIIPMILEKSGDKAEERRHYILSIFLDSFNDVPAYRRLVLFTKLIHLLGKEKFLSFFTVLIFERKFLRFEKTNQEEKDGISALAFSLFQAFPIDTQIRSICALLSVFESRFFEVIFDKANLKFDRKSIKKLESNCVAKEFKLKLKTEEQQFACGVDLLKFILELVSNLEFRYAINCLFKQTEIDNEDDEDIIALKEQQKENLEALTYFFHLLIEMIVTLEPKDVQLRNSSVQFRRQVRATLDDILVNFNQLFPATDILDLIIDKMLNNSYSVDKNLFIFVQRRALRLMYDKLSALEPQDISRSKTLQLLQSLLKELPASFKTIEKNNELVHNVQHLMLAFKACFKFIEESQPKEDNEMELLTDLLMNILTFIESIHIERKRSVDVDEKVLSNLKGSCLICLVQVLCSMTADGIEHLERVVGLLLSNFNNDDEIVLISNLASLSKLITKFGKFLSPYMPKIILTLLPAFEWADRDLGVKARLQSVWIMLAQDVPKRVIFDAISKAYLGSTKISPKAVIDLMLLLKNSCANMEDTGIVLNCFRNFMLQTMDYRAQNIGSVDLKTIEMVETSIGEAFSAFFPKLNESQFRPTFFKLHTAALKTDQSKMPTSEDNKYYSLPKEAYYRMIAFYRFCSHLADTLKSLFCVFVAPLIVKSASEMLDAYHSMNNDEDEMDDDNETQERLHKLAEGPKLKISDESIGEPLIASILSTFSKCFLFDLSGAFVKNDSINTVVKPLIHQISNTNGTPDDYQRRIELILECTQYLIQNNKDETLIKEFNYQILLKTRDSNEKIRIAAIRILHRLILTCAEEYLSFIPEAIPFISEMCEDHSDVVDSYLKKLIIDIEQLVGEPIKKYL